MWSVAVVVASIATGAVFQQGITRAPFPQSALALAVLTLFATAAASATPTCSLAVASTGDTVTLCAPPWPRTPTNTPTLGTVVTIEFTMESSGTGLSAVDATVNGVDVTSSFINAGGSSYTVAYATPTGDTLWPWAGLVLRASLSDGSTLTNFTSTIVPGSTWSEEGGARGMPASYNRGVCMGDVDGDGDIDVFVTSGGGDQNQLWVNGGSGVFTDEAVAWSVAGDAADTAFGCGFADVDGDGLLDLMVARSTDDVNELYMNTGAGFVEDGAARGVRVGDDAMSLSWGDVDGDGDVDVLVCGGGANVNSLFVNVGGGVFTEEGAVRGVGSIARSSRQSVLVDTDGDGDLDAMVVNFNGANELYVNNGTGVFEEVGGPRGFNDGGPATGASVGDWSGDGVVDVYVPNFGAQDLLYVNDGSGGFVEVGVGRGVGASTGKSFGVSMFDFVGDGDLDIFVGVDNGADLVWVNDGASFSGAGGDLVLGSSAATYYVSAGDIDGDGDVDVVIPRSGEVYVNHNAQPGVYRVVVVRPLTASGAQSAFGAVVGVDCVDGCESAWVGVRVIDGGSGRFSQNGYDGVVGVPVPSAKYNVSVRWAGDFHPVANWTTHPALGGVVPASLVTPGSRLLVVRPFALVASVGRVLPWDYPGVSARLGQGPASPVAGDTISIPVVLSPPGNTHDVNVTSAFVNGQGVGVAPGAAGEVLLTYVTEVGDELWPWSGLAVSVTLVDGGGLFAELTTTVVPGSTWSEEGGARGVSADASRGVCMGDVDGDGSTDVFVTCDTSVQSQLWINDGSGVFTDQAVTWNVAGDAMDTAFGCGFADADGDGLLDLMVARRFDDVNELYMNTGSGFVEEGNARGVLDGAENSVGVSWGDVDGDGDVDLFVCSSNVQVNSLYVNDGGGVFSEQGGTRGVGLIARTSYQSVMVDTDGDGDLDILVVNLAGANELYLNNGAGVFDEAGVSRGFADTHAGIGVSVGDWSGDGVVDVYVSNNNHPDLLYLNDGGGVFVDEGADRGVSASTGSTYHVSTLDVEGDGDLDVFVGVQDGADLVWVNDGAGGFSNGNGDLVLGSSNSAYGACVGDIDGDGDVDVVIPRPGDMYVNHNAQPGVHRVVVVRPLTAGGAQSAFGATVRVECADGCQSAWVGLRVPDGGSGLYSQNGYDAVVGVPIPSAKYNVSVRWAGDAWPASNWTTHPALGGVVPASLVTPGSRLLVVRPFALVASVGRVLPWDYPGVSARLGQGPASPVAGDTISIPVVLSPPGNTHDVNVTSAFVNGQDVLWSWSRDVIGSFTVTYATEVGDELWPWSGLAVSVTLVDGGGLFAELTTTVVPGSTWSEESETRGMPALDTSRGVCMGDVDGDGDVDVFVAMNSGTQNQLWINDGSGVFSDGAIAWNVVGVASDTAFGCGFADANADGLLDLLVARYTNDVNELYMNTGVGYVEDGADRGVRDADNTLGVSWGDVDGDGDVDLFVCSTGSVNRLYVNDGGGVFNEQGGDRGFGGIVRSSHQSALVDVDGDGDLDILVVNYVDANELYVNDGTGVFDEAGATRGFNDASNVRSLSVGDWSGDGVVDVYVSNVGSRDSLYLNDGSGVFVEEGVERGMGASAEESHGVSMYDIEGDGDLDVVVGVWSSGADLVWVNDGVGGFRGGSGDLLLGSSASALGACAGDVDGDGDVDVVMPIPGKVYVNHNAQPGVHRVVVVRPLTAGGAQSAFGAVVGVDCVDGCESAWVGVRVIDGGSGYFSQNGYDGVVGVPVPSAKYNVSVRWAGDFHPVANWTTHPALGGVVPASLVTPGSRLLVVRPFALVASVGRVLPWDYPGVSARLGQGPASPVAGDTISIPVVLSPPGNTHDVNVTSAFVNGQGVGVAPGAAGEVLLTYVTEVGDELWPWSGLAVSVTLVDGGGLFAELTTTVVPGSTWSEESSTRGTASFANDHGKGVCMGDVDGDGDVDVFAAMNSGTQNQLWLNDGSGVFSDGAVAWNVMGNAADRANGCGFADADGDGLLDLLVTRWTDNVIELYMNTGVGYVEDGADRGVRDADNTLGVSWGDVDGDGDVDLCVCQDFDKANLLFVNNGGTFVEEGADRGMGSIARNSLQSVMADIDGDGALEVFVVNWGTANELYINDGGGVFEEAGEAKAFHDSSNGVGISVGDWSGDGVMDVYVSNAGSRDLLYLNDGSGVFAEVGVERGVGSVAGDSHGVAMFDIEGDGDLDVFVVDFFGADLVWVNDGVGGFRDGGGDLLLGSSTKSAVHACAGDVNGDAGVDVVIPLAGEVYVNHNAQPGASRFVVVRPLTAAGAQSAFGAVVGVECVDGCEDGWVGVRVIDGGSGRYSQNGYDAVVGVPAPSATYNVSVRWAGDFHPPSNWTTHPRLGGVVPASLSAPRSRLFVVRPAALAASVGHATWDYPGVSTRAGQVLASPVAGDTISIPIVLSPGANTHDVNVTSAFVNGQDVSGSWVASKSEVTYMTEAGDAMWPWSGLDITVTLVDGGGLVSTVTTTTIPGSTWSEESDARGMLLLGNSRGRGVCMGDVDGDNDVDIYVAMTEGTSNQLWINDGRGLFVDEAVARGVAGDTSDLAVGCGFGDVDRDGLLDLMVTRYTDDVNELFMNTGSGFVEEGGARGISEGDDTLGLSWGDVDGDGDVDVFVCRGGPKANQLFVNDGGGVFAEEGAARDVGLIARNSHQSALADVDGDGDLDVLVVNNDHANELYVNGGEGSFLEAGVPRGFADDGDTHGIGVGDWSGDGVVDVYVSNSDGRDLLCLNDGTGFFDEVGVGRGVGGSTGTSYGASMFDIVGDGALDIVVGVWTGADLVWVNDGVGGFRGGSADLLLGSSGTAYGVGAGDIDGDGDLDVAMSSSGDVYVNHNSQPGVRRVVVVRPLTVVGAASAFGAVVRVVCVGGCEDGWVGVRVVDGGGGYFSQNAYDAVVGVPTPSTTYNVSVRWAGDFHPVANWTTHPRLGGVVPSSLLTPASRLFVVRPQPAILSLGSTLPWDYPAVTYRTGEPLPPASGNVATIPIAAPRTASDLSAIAATINGQDVRLTFLHPSPGVYYLEYTTVVGQEAWPWAGLSVELSVVDSAGLTSYLSTVVVPGNTLAAAISSTGLGTLPASSAGLCVGDIDGDGDADIVVAVPDANGMLFVNTGGLFASAPSAFPGSTATSGCALGDVDGDGDLDVFFAVDGTDALFVQSPSLTFADEAGGRGVAFGGTSRSAAWGDVDGDGDIDLFVCVHDGQHVLAVNDGSGEFSDSAAAAGVATVTLCEQAIMVDVDGDADVDILVANGAQADELFINLGFNSGSFLQRASTRGFTAAGDSQGLAAGDVDGDGHIDIVVAQASSATLLFLNDGAGVFSEEGGSRGVARAANTTGVALVDVEHDGDLDIAVGGLSGVVLSNGGGGVFSDRSADLGLDASASRIAVLDFDSDGDMDLLFSNELGVYENFAADGGVVNWLRVRPLTPAGGQSAFGAVVKVVCFDGCMDAWSSVRVINGGSGFHGQQAYDAHFGLPVGGAAFDVEVVFVGGATHGKATDPRLGGVVPGNVVEVVDRPYLVDVVGVYWGGEVLGVDDAVVVIMTAGQHRTDLIPGDGCCFVNGVNVRDSFVGDGEGGYNLTYVVGEGDAEWGAGGLRVMPTLQSAGRNLSMVEVEYALEGSPAGDPVSPVIEFDCRPGVASANVYEPVCVSCPLESLSCNFSYVVESTTLSRTFGFVPDANYSSPTSTSFAVGPFNDSDIATLTVFVVDGAGNMNATEELSWRVDISSPVTTLVTKPDPVTRRPDANFALQCSELVCSFEYRFNGGPLTALGGNGTVGDVPTVDTVMVVGPGRVSPATAPSVSFSVNVSDAFMWVNASVGVEVAGLSWELPVVDNATEVLQLPTLNDGEYVLVAVGKGGDGTSDVTPIRYVFTVDTTPPSVSMLDAPGDGERGNPTIVVGADEDDCVFEWRAGPSPLNASWVVTSSAVIAPEVTSSVPHTFEVRGVDPAGNVGNTVSTSWTPAACPDVVPDIVVTSDVGVSIGQRYITFGVVGDVAWGDFEYHLDDGDWVPSTSPKIILDDIGFGGGHELHVRAAVPSACNSELAVSRPPPQVVTWTEPAPLPLLVTMQTKPDPSTPDVFAEFELLGSRRLAWFEYSLDGEPWTPTEALLRVGPLQAGSHTMRVRAVDSAGLSSGDVQSHSWTITAASDSSIVLTNLPDGEHSLLVVATDEAGSFEVAPNAFVWRVDTTPPTIAANRTSPRFSSSRTAVIDVSCGGEIDDCEFCWTSGTVAGNCSSTSPLLVTSPEDGYHVVDVRAVDSVGLESTEGVGIEWTVDSTPPIVALVDVDHVLVPARHDTGNVDAVLGNTSLRLNLTTNEDVLGFDVTLNGGVVGGGRIAGPILELTDLPVIINSLVVSGVDLSGNAAEDVVLRVMVDVTPPQTLPFTTPPPSLTNALSVTVGVSGEDGASGVDGLAVSLLDGSGNVVDVVLVDGASGVVVFGNFTTGVYNVAAVAVDVAGNVEGGGVVATMVVDHVPPVSEFAESVPALAASPNLTVWVAASEVGQQFAKVVGVTTWLPTNASGAVTFTHLSDGSHVVELRSIDLAGNEDLEPYVSSAFAVDTTPPATVSAVFGAGLIDGVGLAGVDAATPETAVSVNVSADGAVAGYRVAVNGTAWSELVVGPTIEVPDLAEGVTAISVAAVDLAGNVDPSPSQHVILVDLTPPDSSRVVSMPQSPTLLPNISVEVAGEDVAGGIGISHMVVSVVRLGDGVGRPDTAVEGSSGRVWVSSLTTGVYNVSVVGVDAVGNTDRSPGWEAVVVDQVPPVSGFSAAPPALTKVPGVSVWVGANEVATTSGRVVGVTGWLPANASEAVTFTGLPDGNHTVELRSVDVAGNEELEPYVSAAVVVDTVAPVLFWTADVEPFTSSSSVSGCFAANDSNHVSFSASPASVVVHSDGCFELGVGEDGGFVVNVTGADAAGNVGEVLATSWVLDRDPPSSAITASIQDSSPACVNGSVTVCDAPTSATLTVACDDGNPSVAVSPCRPQYAITLVKATVAVGCAVSTSTRRRLSTDGFVDAPAASFTLDTTDGDGLYAVAVRSVDDAGNVEAGNTTLTWYVDTVAPVSAPTLVQTPDKVVSSTTALFVIQLSDDNSPGQTAFLYKLDGGMETPVFNLPSPNSASVQLELPGLLDGDHKVEVWARDQAGHNGPFVLYDWAVVTTAPGVDILSTPAAISADVTPSFVFQAVWVNGSASGSGAEPLAGIEVSLSGDATFTTVCEDTVSSGSVCVWNASLADRGEGSYTVNVRAVLGGNTGDPTPHTWSYTLCDDDQYAVIGDDGGIECFSCPPGGDCSGRRTSQADIAAVQGFWAPPGSTGLQFYECPVEEACLPGGDVVVGNSTLHVVSQCNEGYTGTLCAVCEDGFFEQFGLCVSCGTQSGVAWVIMFAVLVAVIGVGVLFFKFRDLMPIDQLKVTLSMTQIIASASTAYDIPWPPLFADFLNTMRVFLIEAVSLTRANCAQPMTFYGSLTVTLVAFKVVLLVVVFGPVLLHKWKQRGRQNTLPLARPTPQQPQRARRRSSIMVSMAAAVHAAQAVDWAKIFKITFLFLFVAYPGVSLKIMKTFKCVEVEGEYWLVADMRLRCYEGDWYGYALYAFVMACLYTGGLPLAITVILWRNRGRLGEEGVVAKWGFLYETYGVGAYLWEVVELLRKLWLSALVVLMEEGSPLQVTVAVLISGWAHVLHAVYKPWRGIGDGGNSVYALQHGSLFVTCFVFIMGLLFKVEGVSQDGTTYNFLAWVMLLACIGFLIAAALVLVAAVAAQLRKSRAKASLVGSSNSDRGTARDRVGGWSGGALPSSPGDAASGSRPGAVPRAVRASRMSGVPAGQMAWVGNPLRAAEKKATPK